MKIKRDFKHVLAALPKGFKDQITDVSYLQGVLEGGYDLPDRHYHDFGHIENMIYLLSDMNVIIKMPLDGRYYDMYAAILFHDLVYEVSRSDNETRSAEMAMKCGPKCIEEINFPIVMDYILATTHKGFSSEHTPSFEEQLICDIDLMGLMNGTEDRAVACNEIYKEYSLIYNYKDFINGRIKFFNQLLNRAQVFYLLGERAESLIRQNITQDLITMMRIT